jgi:hypothetical protein
MSSLAAKMAVADQRREATEEQCERQVHELTLLSLRGSELCITITDAPPLAPSTRGCALQWPSTPRWLPGYPRFGWWCLWPPNPFSGTCPLMLPRRVLQERWSSSSRSEQSSAPISRLMDWWSTTLSLDRWMSKPI